MLIITKFQFSGEEMIVKEVELTKSITEQLIALSEEWEKENSCYGYHKNDLQDIEGKRIFLAMDGDKILGYLFGHSEVADENTSVYKTGEQYFEIDEIYVSPQYRNQGIGKKLFKYVENEVSTQFDIIKLTTATKNFRAILHFYIDELGMEFWSAVLFKRVR